MLCKAKEVVYSEIHTKYTHAMWVTCRIFEYSTWWNAKQPLGFISLILWYHLGYVRPRVPFFLLRFWDLRTTVISISLIIFSLAHRPRLGESRLIAEVSISHAITPTHTQTQIETHTHTHTNTHTHTHADTHRHTHTHTDTHTHTHTHADTHPHTVTDRDTHTRRHTHTHTHRQTDRHTHTHTHKHTHADTHRQTDRQTHTHTHSR